MARLAPSLLLLATFASVPSLAAAQSSKPTRREAPADLASASYLTQEKVNKESWTFRKQGLSVRSYTGILVDRTGVYTGADAQFGKVSAANRQKYADIFTDTMKNELGKVLPLAAGPGPNILRLKITLIGMTTTQGGLATVTRVLPVGLVLNTVKSSANAKGSFTGSILYAVELTNAATGELLIAAVRRASPDAMDIGSTLSTQDTVESVADHLAKGYRARLQGALHPAK